MTELTQEFHPENLKNLVADTLQEALKQGASSAEVDLTINKGFSVNAHKGDAETIEYHQDKVIDIAVYFGKKTGSSSLSDFSLEGIRAAVRAACNIARFTDEDPCAGLADKELLAFNYPKLELVFPWNISVEQAIKLACECESKALSQDKRIIHSEAASVTTSEGLHFYGNTLGFMGSYGATRHEMSLVLVAKQGDEMQRDYGYTVSVDPALMDSVATVATRAVQRTVNRLGARRLKTQRVPVIFMAEEARGLLGSFLSAIQGSHLYRKSSFLLDHLGKRIFPDNIRIEEQPFLAKGLGSAPFDGEGVATRPNVFIEDGILRSYVLGVYSARKLGMQTTGNSGGVHNLIINTGKNDLPALIKKMGKGILVTELIGQGVNLVTGDYSRGAAGFWVENGVIQYPVEEITIAGNLRDMFQHMAEIGSDVDIRGNIRTGSILISEMTIAGN